MNPKLARMVCAVFLLAAALSGCAQREAARKPEAQNQEQPKTETYSTLLQAAEADPYEDGCVSCHKKTADVDRSLPAYVGRIEGHPQVKEATVNACYNCHEAQKNYKLYKAFTRGMHLSHWKSETFYTKTEGRCYSCHTVETNGVSGIKNYPLAGYRTGITEQKQAAPKAQATPKPQPKEKKQAPVPNQGQQQPQPTPTPGTNGAEEDNEIPTPTP